MGVWGQGEAGVRVPMTILKGNQLQQIEVVSADLRQFLQASAIRLNPKAKNCFLSILNIFHFLFCITFGY